MLLSRPCGHRTLKRAAGSPRDHGPHPLVRQQLHKEGVVLPPINDVGRLHTLCDAPHAAIQPVQGASGCQVPSCLSELHAFSKT